MSRFVVVLLGLSLAAGAAVALVHAQESSQRRNWQDSANQPSAASGSTSNPSNTVRPPGSLADRLKAIRSADNQASPFTQGGVAPSTENTAAGDNAIVRPAPLRAAPVEAAPTTVRPAPSAGEAADRMSFRPTSQQTPATSADGGGSFVPTSPDAASEAGVNDPGLHSVLKRQEGGASADDASPVSDSPRMAQRPGDENVSSRRGAVQSGVGASTSSPSETATARNPWSRDDFTRTARAGSAAPSPSPESLHLISTGPALRVETIGPKSVAIGQEASYTIRVTNAGDVSAEEMVVMVDLPAWVQVVGGEASLGRTEQESDTGSVGRLVWSIDSLATRATEQLQLKVIPRASRPFDVSVNWGFAPPTTGATIEVQEPQLHVAVLGPDEVLFGQPTTYKIVLSNPGTGEAQHVAVSLAPLSPAGGEKSMQQVGNLAAGETRELQIEVTPRDAGGLALQIEATADGELRSDATKQVRVRRAALQVEASGPALKYAGTSATYQVTIVNAGDAVAENVEVDLHLPAGAKYTGGVDQATTSARGITWNLGRLPAGGRRVFDVQCEMLVAGDVKFEAAARGDGDLSASHAIDTRVEAIADVKLMVSDPQGPKAIGADAVYELHIVNRGSKEARGVSAVMQFSQGIEPVSADGHSAELVPGQVVFATIDRLEPGQEKTLRVTARADTAGNHVFRAEVRCANPETRRVSEGTTRFFQADQPSNSGPAFNVGRRP
ncbi:MAG: hypothetical protein RIC55_08305 [Pirellulaceae bacterium]